MALNSMSIATHGYVCEEQLDAIAIATHGYVCAGFDFFQTVTGNLTFNGALVALYLAGGSSGVNQGRRPLFNYLGRGFGRR